MHVVRAKYCQGKVELLEPLDLPEGADLLVTASEQTPDAFWVQASGESLAAVWDNTEDDVYAALFEG